MKLENENDSFKNHTHTKKQSRLCIFDQKNLKGKVKMPIFYQWMGRDKEQERCFSLQKRLFETDST